MKDISKHHQDCHIKWLNTYGCLSIPFLIRKAKVDWSGAAQILASICDHHDNVYFLRKGIIVIRGREPEIHKTKRLSRWIDVTKP